MCPEPGPYPGLRPFTEEQQESFFGREAEVAALWEKLQRRKLLSLIGPSGVGKTSFVRAGLVPARPSGWRCVTATPGRRPFASLARALVPELASDTEALQELVGFDDPDVAVRLVGRWRRRHAGALVVVDQLEELFTLNPPDVQAAFAELLRRLCDEADVHVLLSLRDDFFFACHAHPALAEVFTEVTPLGPLAGDALRRALVEPAQRNGFRFEDEALVEEMCGAVEGERGALPLLAFCAAELWERRDRERKLRRGPRARRSGCRRRPRAARGGDARRDRDRAAGNRPGDLPQPRDRAGDAGGVRARGAAVGLPGPQGGGGGAGALVDARLLTSYEDEGTADGSNHHRIEIVHESLLKAWPRLVRWQTQDEEGALLRDQLKQAAHLWDEKGRPADLLWSGTSFREYELWRERYSGKLTALEEQFTQAMTNRALRMRRLRRASVAAVVVALSAVAIVVSWSRHQAAKARDEARAAAQHAEASRLVALGKLELQTEPTLTLAYARKSLEVRDSSEARRLALEALWRGPVARVLPLPKESDVVSFVTPSPDGQWLSCSGWGSVITLVSADGTTTRVLPNNRNAARPRMVLFSDDSRRLATFASGDTETIVWSVEGREVTRLRPGGYPRRFVGGNVDLWEEPAEDRPEFRCVARRIGSPEARTLVRAPGSGAWDVDFARDALIHSKGRALFSRPLGAGTAARGERRVGEHGATVAGVSIHETTGWIVSFDERREVRMWDGATHRLLRTLQGLDPDRFFGAPILDARGTLLAWHSLRERAFPVWDLAGPPDAEPVLLRKSEVTGDAGGGAFLPDGRWLVTALMSKVAFWPLNMPWPRVIHGRESGLYGIVFTPDSRQLVSCGTLATRVYPVAPDAPAAHPITSSSGPFTCYGLAMEATGNHVLLAATAHALLLAPLDGAEPQALVRVPPTESIMAVALDAAGRWAVTAVNYAPDPEDRVLHVIDRRTGTARVFTVPGSAAESAWAGSVTSLRFVPDGRLMATSTAGLYLWNVETGAREVLHPAPCGPMDASADGRLVAVGCKGDQPGSGAGGGRAHEESPQPPYELLVIDASTGERRRIETHGTDIVSLAVSPSGEVLATGDTTGTVRVGRVDGSEPHLLVGAGGLVSSLAFSPDGRWIASTAGNDIRLWPMPDMSQPPLHTLPRDALLAKLDAVTNVRVVVDVASPSGYRVDLAPFPGWKDVPAW